MKIYGMTLLAAALVVSLERGDQARQVTDEGFRTRPPAAWLAEDPADSLYRAAREALNRNDYRRAASLFAQISREHPRSGYVGEALYWEAFALYRLGGRENLERAQERLELQAERHEDAATFEDGRSLRVRVKGALARLGNADAAADVLEEAQRAGEPGPMGPGPGPGSGPKGLGPKGVGPKGKHEIRDRNCPPDDDEDMRVAALNAVMQMDEENALPILRRVLARRDDCSASLRRKAVMLLSHHDGPESRELLMSTVRSDPDQDVRLEAVQWLSHIESPAVVPVLDSIARNADDPAMRERAVMALAMHESSRARQALWAMVDDPSLSEEARERIIVSLGHFNASDRDASALRSLYGRTRSEKVRSAIIQAMAHIESPESRQWLLGRALDPAEQMDVRKQAIFWAANDGDTPIRDIIALYERLHGQVELAEHVIFTLSNRDEREATDKLIEIARTEQNRSLRAKAIFWLGQKKDDPRVRQLLLEIIGQ